MHSACLPLREALGRIVRASREESGSGPSFKGRSGWGRGAGKGAKGTDLPRSGLPDLAAWLEASF